MNTLQNIVFPDISLKANHHLYFRTHNTIDYLTNKEIHFNKGGRLECNTYFNVFEISLWKNKCNIMDVSVSLELKGNFLFKIFLLDDSNIDRYLLQENIVESSEKKQHEIMILDWEKLQSGLIFIELHSLNNDGIFFGGAFLTNTPPLHQVKLGLVITHYNRKQFVVPAIKRIMTELVNQTNNISLVVIDNSQNISEIESSGATIIKNKNLGGSGGFTRGLLYLKDNEFSHCLFMDDDATCEIECLIRAYTIFCYAINPKTAISGSLLEDIRSSTLLEKGGLFDIACCPPYIDFDVIHQHSLSILSKNEVSINYGAWWFFGFNISEISYYPFPFFVRGDDILFSLDNKFDLIAPIGIACWGERFDRKESPITKYLTLRSTLVINYLINSDKKKVLKWLSEWFFSNLYTYNYASARSTCDAIEHVLQGPDFFIKNIQMTEILKFIGEYAKEEKLYPIEITKLNIKIRHGTKKENKFRFFKRKLSLNGILLPSYRKQTLYQYKRFAGSSEHVLGHAKVLNYDPSTRTGYVSKINRMTSLSLLLRFMELKRALNKHHARLSAEYQRKHSTITSENFWRNVYK